MRTLATMWAALAIAAGPTPGWAQPREVPPEFEAASVKLLGESNSLPPGFSNVPQRSGGRIHWVTNPFNLVRYAYHLQNWRLAGVNLLVSVDPFYAIDATTGPSASDEEIRRMFQALLKERLHFAAHYATKRQNGFALVTGKKRTENSAG